MLKFDIVLNHLSVESPQFKDLLQNGNQSIYKDFFINWNEFWEGQGSIGNDGVIIPKEEFLSKLFMRKSGLPVLKVLFPDGTEKPYWNTFYQDVKYNKISPEDLKNLKDLTTEQVISICEKINHAIEQNHNFNSLNLDDCNQHKEEILQIVNKKRSYLGQMDVNAKSEIVWDFYEETLKKVSSYGCKILRLDAFAYLHKEIGQSNFFNRPGTWDYLEKLSQMAEKYNLVLLPEIHAEYGLHLHEEVAGKGYYIYDFFLPGLTIHTLENKSNKALIAWAREVLDKGYKTVNMLGCHDGIPVLDLKGKEVNGSYNKGLLEDTEIKCIMNKIMERGGRVKNLYDPSGKKISYYQVNATFFSALGESEQKLLLARAIQMFMPGIPQVWYLDLFAGKNDHIAANRGGNSSHKEINRTTLTMNNVEEGLKKGIVINQLTLIRLRNTSKAFHGAVKFNQCLDSEIDITWSNRNEKIQLKANLKTYKFSIRIIKGNLVETITF
jgi:sucrose phosphorylase